MPRREFSKKTKAEALLRCQMRCEGTLDDGSRCNANLRLKPFHFDHDNPDGLTGEPTLENCVVLCVQCHGVKTFTKDIPAIAKAKRREAKHIGIKKRSSFANSKEGRWKTRLTSQGPRTELRK